MPSWCCSGAEPGSLLRCTTMALPSLLSGLHRDNRRLLAKLGATVELAATSARIDERAAELTAAGHTAPRCTPMHPHAHTPQTHTTTHARTWPGSTSVSLFSSGSGGNACESPCAGASSCVASGSPPFPSKVPPAVRAGCIAPPRGRSPRRLALLMSLSPGRVRVHACPCACAMIVQWEAHELVWDWSARPGCALRAEPRGAHPLTARPRRAGMHATRAPPPRP